MKMFVIIYSDAADEDVIAALKEAGVHGYTKTVEVRGEGTDTEPKLGTHCWPGKNNMLMMAVYERTREIGIRQSVGATPNDIRLQFLAEALMLSLVGGLIGIAAGVGGAILFGATSDMRTVIVPGSIVLAFASAARSSSVAKVIL